jgi:antitoxin (DNA-binding transcriptional repressor) of toxin-antitoxin stability system
MRSAQVSELKERLDEVLEAVKNGETVEIKEDDAAVGEFVPSIHKRRAQRTSEIEPAEKMPKPAGESEKNPRPDQSALKAHIDDLVRQGKARRGKGTLPPDFLTRPLPKAKKSVLEALLEDRHSD